MRVTHPFHPLAGCHLRRVGERSNASGRRVICLDDVGTAWALPIDWTDLAVPDAERAIGAGRAYVLVDDLLGLADLVARPTRPGV